MQDKHNWQARQWMHNIPKTFLKYLLDFGVYNGVHVSISSPEMPAESSSIPLLNCLPND